MHKVFISYHHANDQKFKDALSKFGQEKEIFIDSSVNIGDIPDDWDDEKIREEIRDNYLKDSTVTIVLVGLETKNRKHIDWEIYSSMFDGKVNKKSGIIVIYLPSTQASGVIFAGHGQKEKQVLYPHITGWTSFKSRADCERRHPYLPARIIDNLIKEDSYISVSKWENLNEDTLKYLIDLAFDDKKLCNYDLSKPLRRHNS